MAEENELVAMIDPENTDGYPEFSSCPTLLKLLADRSATGRSGRAFENIGAVSTVNNLRVLRGLMLDLKPTRTLEIGLCFGASCLLLAAAHRDLGRAPENQHLAIDPFQSSVWDDAAHVLLEQAGLDAYVDVRSNFSCLELPRLLESAARFGLVYVDGSHLFEDVFVDAYYCARLLEEGGVVAFDDSADPHIRKVIGFIRSNWRTALTEVDLSTYRQRGPSIQYRIARHFGKVQLTAFRRVGDPIRGWNARFRSF